MKDQNRLRIARLAERYARRRVETASRDDEGFARAFDDVRREVLRPVLEEVAAELRRCGHEPSIAVDVGAETPSIELRLGLAGAPSAAPNRVGFCVIRRDESPMQVLAYLEATPPVFDLVRFARPSDIGPDQAEQLVVDAVEHIIAVNTP